VGIYPASLPIDLKGADTEAIATFTVKPPDQDREGTLQAIVSIRWPQLIRFERVRILYPHIGVHTPNAAGRSQAIRADIREKGSHRLHPWCRD